MGWFGDFFGALPDALRALYLFGDPNGTGQGWWGAVIALIWAIPLTAVPLAISRMTYGKREWVSATMGVIGTLSIFMWVYGVLPSAWLYYVDSSEEILADRVIPTSLTFTIGGVYFPVATNFYDVIRDLVVVFEHLIALGITFWAAMALQKRYPRALAPGEETRESGGYH